MADRSDCGEGVKLERRGAAAIITLDRGGALNALTPSMLAALAETYPRLARDPNLYVVTLRSADPKAFSAGGDMRILVATARGDLGAACAALRAEYALNWLHECFSKPSVAFIDGIVMGSGVGITAYATHRVGGPGYRFAMPETGIGFFPDVGSAYFLARLPDRIGVYLGLTGASIGRADAYHLGLLTHCLTADAFAAAETAFTDAMPIDPELDNRHVDPGSGELMAHAKTIATCFSAATVEDILARLSAVTGTGQPFAQATVAVLQTRAPLALKVTLRHLRESVDRDLRLTLQADYRLACRFLAAPDVFEGVRAHLTDKDRKPIWQPSALADVTPDVIDDYFAALPPDKELNLPLRQDMQDMRV